MFDVNHMRDFRPYMLRCAYSWIQDSGFSPVLIANPLLIKVPEFIGEMGRSKEWRVNLVDPDVCNYQINDDHISFLLVHKNNEFKIEIPMDSIVAMVALENGVGVQFSKVVSSAKKPGRPHLSIVKN